MRFSLVSAIALTFLAGSSGMAQSGSERAFIALRATPVGALTPILTPAMSSRRLSGAQLAIRYGFVEEQGTRWQSVAGSAIFGAGLASSVILTGGVLDADCLDCPPRLMLGVGGDVRVYESGDAVGSGSSLSLAVSGDLGYGRLINDATAFSFGVGAPLTLTFAATPEGLRFAPFFSPVFGIGSTSDDCFITDCTRSGTRWVLGGGVGVWNPMSSIAASAGVNYVWLDGARPVFGVSVHIGGR